MAIRTESHNDLSKFGNRLWALMERNGYDVPWKLATDLYDTGLATVNSNPKPYTSSYEIRKNAIGSIEKKIVKHLHSSDMKKVQGEYIHAYCQHFNCSADYLFGYTNIISNDLEIRKICELTGISEQAITQLTEHTKKQETPTHLQKCWSRILESELFWGIPYDWSTAHNEACAYMTCNATAQALSDILEKENLSPFTYNHFLSKEKPLIKAANGHYAAYYGMLYKLAQNITNVLDKLVKSETEEADFFNQEYIKITKQLQKELYLLEGKPVPKNLENEDFHWNTHIIV